ncbi:MAG: RNA degradosome polyphosphate kinase [Kiloniella sp.]|nr:RNA degradosome polyphosphate kinase [Kiloniella sp.]
MDKPLTAPDRDDLEPLLLAEQIGMDAPERFINREISWLGFNERVLAEAQREQHPLLERLRFVAISATNLEEFIMVRFAGLKAQVRARMDTHSPEGLTSAQQVAMTAARVRDLQLRQLEVWHDLRNELKQRNIDIIDRSELSDSERQHLEETFETEWLPVLTPISVDPSHPFPFIRNLAVSMVMELTRQSDNRRFTGLLMIPSDMPGFIRLPRNPKGHSRIVPAAEVLHIYLDHLFPGFRVENPGFFQLFRDSDIELAEEAEDLVRLFETALKRRTRGDSVSINVDDRVPDHLVTALLEEFGLEQEDCVRMGRDINLAQLSEICDIDRPELKFQPYEPRYPDRVRDFDGDCFAAIRAKDFVIHHPFESFDVVVRFLHQAAADPDVVAIKQTLYRTSNDSPIISALKQAAEAGKSVTALVELKARFDEEANIRWARDMERAGVQVVYGFLELKTHAKVSLVARREAGGMRTYCHFGTGNYHPITARIYTDLSYFTDDVEFAQDAGRLFNYMTSYAVPSAMNRLSLAPLNMRETLMDAINGETAAARAGEPSGIWAKMNSLVDPEIIDALYVASQAGVKIELVIRGICCLRPGIKGLSETISVTSIIGRFLEHSRICCFANGATLPSRQARVFISSADWMPRNINRRVETLIPILNETVHQQILDEIMMTNLRDTANTWVLRSDGSYVHRTAEASKSISSHQYFMENPSLSGRGRAGSSGKGKGKGKIKGKNKVKNNIKPNLANQTGAEVKTRGMGT